MKTVAFANRKGGTGKTTSAVSIAACIAQMGKRVILLDLDPQANATAALGVERAGQGCGSQALFAGEVGCRKLVRETMIEKLAVIPSGSDLAVIEYGLSADRKKKWQGILRKRIGDLKKEYDMVVIDCPPSIGPLSVNALVAADGVVVTLQCDYFSLEGLAEFAANIERLRAAHNSQLVLFGLLKTMYDARTLLSRQVAEQLERHFGTKVFDSPIPRTVRLAEAPSHGLPISLYAPASAAASAYQEVSADLLRRMA